ncbi:hypothetical protein ABK040_007065 [Willaertia magna]
MSTTTTINNNASNNQVINNNRMKFIGSSKYFYHLHSGPLYSRYYCNFTSQNFCEKNLKIKKIISGGSDRYRVYNCLWAFNCDYNNSSVNENYFCNEDTIYFYPLENSFKILTVYKNYFTKINDWKFKFHYKKMLNELFCNDCEIKDIFGNACGIFIWLKNNYLFYLNFRNNTITQIETTILQKQSIVSKEITKIVTGITSTCYFIQNVTGNTFLCNGAVMYDNNFLQQQLIENKELDNSEPSLFGCYNDDSNDSVDTNIIITKENKLFIKREFNEPFQYKNSIFEKESKAIDLQCGGGHVVILLENQCIYAFGLNTLNQCGVFTTTIDIAEPTKLTIPLNSKILSIHCAALGTVIVCKNEIIFIGDQVENEENRTRRISTNFQLEDDDENVIGNELNYFNSVACGPWHYIVYRKCDKPTLKSLEYFMSNLKSSRRNCFCDVVIMPQC